MRFSVLLCTVALIASAADWRDIRSGNEIPHEFYADQPYLVVTADGKWLCVLTTGAAKEGSAGQHIISTISADKGRTWSKPVPIEDPGGPEASWAMPFKTTGGRIYVFYTYNRDNIRKVEGAPERIAGRVDTLGVYAFRYSDDNGRTWSKQRYEIPMRTARIDRENNYGGRVLFFWGVGKPIVHKEAMIMGFAKVGRWGDPGTQVVTEGWFLRSPNILQEPDPAKIAWETLPDGEEGLRAPKGRIADEANPTPMNDGSLYATYRTIDGYLCHAYSRDGGHTWTEPAYGVYSPGGRRIKHPRAANFVRRFSNGKYLLWYHNAGGEAVYTSKVGFSSNRNPVWVSGGIEKGGFIHWSEPELLLYDPDGRGISYPDFIEDGGRYFVTETQKSVARVHEIDPELLHGIWNEVKSHRTPESPNPKATHGPFTAAMPRLPQLDRGGGLTLDFWVRFDELSPQQMLFDSRDAHGKGLQLTVSDRQTLQLTMNDGRRSAVWDSDPGTHPGTLRMRTWHHVSVIVDGGPKIIMFVIDGVLNDGGPLRVTGWGTFDRNLADVNGLPAACAAQSLRGELAGLKIYSRALCTAEAVANWRAGRRAM